MQLGLTRIKLCTKINMVWKVFSPLHRGVDFFHTFLMRDLVKRSTCKTNPRTIKYENRANRHTNATWETKQSRCIYHNDSSAESSGFARLVLQSAVSSISSLLPLSSVLPLSPSLIRAASLRFPSPPTATAATLILLLIRPDDELLITL